MNSVINKKENKLERMPIANIMKKMQSYTLRFDHPSQRESGQWNTRMKSNLISDILQNNPVPNLVFAEQDINGITITWNLDGKQRCSNVYEYINDGFKISKSVRRNIIQYQSIARDENGKPIIEGNMPKYEIKEFDIVNKKFSQLPEELQDAINEYCFNVTLFLDCDDEDIVYNIERYNDGRPMNQAQKGVIRLGIDFAEETKEIVKNDFFKEVCELNTAARTNGTVERIVSESVMAINFLDDWKKNQEDMCAYIRENANIDMFSELNETMNFIAEVAQEEHKQLFTSKDSFVWLTVIYRALQNGVSENSIVDFMSAFVNELHEKSINGLTFDELKGNKSTKDKSLIVKKINHLEALINDFVGAAA